jgi:ASC-1-like (ASCH) protein
MKHELKLSEKYFEDVISGVKKFELRYNDRNYQVGDELLLKEWNTENNTYTGRETTVEVIYILSLDYFFEKFIQSKSTKNLQNPFANYVILGIR